MTVLAFIALSTAAFAQETASKELLNPIYTGVTSLSMSPDSRAGALGDTGAATTPDVNSQYWNPAKYSFTGDDYTFGIGGSGFFSFDSKHRNYNLVSFIRLSKRLTISASGSHYSLGKVAIEQTNGAERDSIAPTEFFVDLACSYRFSRCFSAAIAVRYIKSDLQYYYLEDFPAGRAFAADLALYYHKVFMNGGVLGIGLNASNIGTKISYDGGETELFLPANLRIGASLKLPVGGKHSLMFCVDANKRMTPTLPTYTEFMTQEYPEFGPEDKTFYKEYQKWLYNEGHTNMSPIAAIASSFTDAPGGVIDELKEIYGGCGIEYGYNEVLFARCGFHYESTLTSSRTYATIGAGINLGTFDIDAAYVLSTAKDCPFNNTLRLSLSLKL